MKTFLFSIFLFFSSLSLATQPHQIVVFGDSLSDTGNLYEYMKHQLPLSPPYYEGRFSNGQVWVEYLTKSYFPRNSARHLLNYAIGGAGVSEAADDDVLFTFKNELDSYFLSHKNKADPRDLYIVWIGSNNYLAMPENQDASTKDVIQGIEHGLERLAKAGAKHLLVVNLPSLGRIPLAQSDELQKRLNEFALSHNQALAERLDQLKARYPKTNFLLFDVHQIIEDIVASPLEYGFHNIDQTCYESLMSEPEFSPQLALRLATRLQLKQNDDGCNGFLFFDPLHPTTVAHKLLAEKARAFLRQAGL